MPDPTPLTLLRYLWAEADVPAPGGPNPAGTPAKVREFFSADDPLSIDIEAALDAARQSAPEAGLHRKALTEVVDFFDHTDDGTRFAAVHGYEPNLMNVLERVRAALATLSPDTAAHLAWLRDGDRLARALIASTTYYADEPLESVRQDAADIIAVLAALEAQP